jgi:hypothetical protein
MKTTYTKSEINWGCYNNRGQRKQDTIWFTENLSISDILDTDIPLKDKSWFIRHNCEFTDKQFREFAIGCSLCVLPIYEAKYPNNLAPRKAIEAAQAYLENTITIEELREARKAAAADADAAADAAAYTTTAADAAATYAAAYTTTYATYAAAADADAADAAAADAAAYSADASYKDLLLQFFKEFTKEV